MTDTTANTSTGEQGTGEQGTGEQGTNTPTPTPRDLQQKQEAQKQNDEGGEGEGQKQGKPLGELDPAVQRELDRARNDAARYRTEKDAEVQQARQEAEARIQAILKAAGINTGEDEDPEKAAEADRQAREKAEQDARDARVELAVYRAASGANADPTALLDSRDFLSRVQDIDPTDEAAIKDAISKAVDANPRLAATQAAARSSADFTGGSGDGAITQEKFNGMDMQERNALYQSDPDTYRRLAATK